jgi:hypothetical protein
MTGDNSLSMFFLSLFRRAVEGLAAAPVTSRSCFARRRDPLNALGFLESSIRDVVQPHSLHALLMENRDMRIPSKLSYLVTGCATLAMLADCSGGVGGIATPSSGGGVIAQSALRAVPAVGSRTPPCSFARPNLRIGAGDGAFKPFVALASMTRNATGNTIAISDGDNDVVDIFNAQGRPTGQLTGFNTPSGLASDIKGDLYVADFNNARIQVYGKGLAGSPTSISDSGQLPYGIDSFNNGAYLAVASLPAECGGRSTINIFKGSTLVTTIASPNLQQAAFCAFDATGNLYFDGYDENNAVIVGEVADATSGGSTYTTLTTSNAIADAGGVQVTTGGQIAIGDDYSSVIYTYNPPVNGCLGAPVKTTRLSGSVDVVSFAFTKNMSDLYAADSGTEQAAEYAYPAGGTPVSTIAIGGRPIGVAIIPTQFPKVMK